MARPNVVVLFSDQQRSDTTGVHGCPLDLTPNFDRMAAEGTHLVNTYTCQPVCGPARAAMQTGRYPTQTGCYRNGIALGTEERTLAHFFGQAGYRTGYIGKWHLANGEGAVAPESRGGYDYWLAANGLEMTSDAYDCVVFDGAGRPVKLPGYRVDALADAAIRFIDANRNDAFLLFVSFLEPHHQNHRDDYPAPDGYAERYAGRWTPPDLAALGGSAAQHLPGYFGQVRRLDEALGRVRDALKSLDLADRTVILYTSDHGNHFKTRNDEYKRSCHDACLRVPAALAGPGFDAGGRIRELVSLVDFAPTLLEAAGIPVPTRMSGRSIVPLLRGSAPAWPKEVFAQISESQVGRCIRTHRWKYSVVAPDRDGIKDSASDTYVEEHLYDLQADPYELTDLVDCEAHRELRRVLAERLIRRMQEAGEPAPTILPCGLARPAGQRRVHRHEIPWIET